MSNTSFENEHEELCGPSCNAWVATGIAVVGGIASADSSRKAAHAQSDAANAASGATLAATDKTNALTAEMYKNGLLQNAPYQQGGQLALSALMGGMGLGSAHNYGMSSGRNGPTGDVGGPGMSPGGAGGPIGTYTNAQGQPVDAQGNAITSTDQYGIGGINYGATNQDLANASGTVGAGSLTHQFNAEDFKNGIDPGYQWRLDQGNSAINSRRAATGNRLGGQALKDIAGYNQDMASQEYGNAYNRYTTNQNNIYNRLSALAGTGQTAGQAAANAGSTAAGNIGSNTMAGVGASNNYLTGGAAANAAGMVGSTNALVGGLNGAMNNYTIGRYLNGGGGGGGGTSGKWDPVTGTFH
jgi:hypothetical protein